MTVTSNSSPSLTIELLAVYSRSPSIALRNQIVKLNAGLVRKIAYRLSHQCQEPLEDLEQVGYLGLIRAIERFDLNHGYAFSSFAVPYIRGEILHFLRDRTNAVKIPRRWQETHRKGLKVREELTHTLGRPPKDSEVAEKLNISINEWQTIQQSAINRTAISLDAAVAYHTDMKVSLGDLLPDEREQFLQVEAEERQQLQSALHQLEEKKRTAIECVYYKGMSRQEASEWIGVSPMTVTRRLHQGIAELIDLLQPQSAASTVS
jgi:RNA polymerase sigma-B factor